MPVELAYNPPLQLWINVMCTCANRIIFDLDLLVGLFWVTRQLS